MTERRARAVLDRADPRWLDAARQVIAGHVPRSRPVRGLLLAEIEERLAQQHGPGVVPVPSQTTGYELLRGAGPGHERVHRQHEGQAVDREPAAGRLRAAAGDPPGRVRGAGHQPAGRVRDGAGDLPLGAVRAQRRDGPVLPVRSPGCG